MSTNFKLAFNSLLFASFFTIAACDSGPKVIESEPAAGTEGAQHQHSAMPAEAPGANEEHKVIAEETLHTDKYTYVRVNENGQSNWIAIPKSNVEIGATYYFKGGLMKKNFESKEFNRVFETLLLVSGISTQPVGSAAPAAGGSAVDQALSGGQNVDVSPPTSEIKPVKGSVKISEIMGNLSKFDGKTIKVTGKVTKVNPMIMGRNWLHVQDGSANNFDLTITTTENIQPGSIVTLEGVIALNKDFGAGYKYNVIMEGATVAK